MNNNRNISFTKRIAAISVFWFLLGLILGAQYYLSFRFSANRISETGYFDFLIWHVCLMAFWIPVTEILFRSKNLIQTQKEKRTKLLFTHVFLSALISVLSSCYFYVTGGYLSPYASYFNAQGSDIFLSILTSRFHTGIFIYFAVAGAIYFYRKQKEFTEKEIETYRLKSLLKEAELQTLKNQISPHFLFNTLNTIVMLLRKKALQETEEVILNLSELLREALSANKNAYNTVKDEMAFAEKYLAIEQARFTDRLTVSTNMDLSVEEVSVPSLVLQPLAENAIKHNLSKESGTLHVQLFASAQNGVIELGVSDNGHGLPPDFDIDTHKKIGLGYVIARLQEKDNGTHFILSNKKDLSGVEAKIVWKK